MFTSTHEITLLDLEQNFRQSVNQSIKRHFHSLLCSDFLQNESPSCFGAPTTDGVPGPVARVLKRLGQVIKSAIKKRKPLEALQGNE